MSPYFSPNLKTKKQTRLLFLKSKNCFLSFKINITKTSSQTGFFCSFIFKNQKQFLKIIVNQALSFRIQKKKSSFFNILFITLNLKSYIIKINIKSFKSIKH